MILIEVYNSNKTVQNIYIHSNMDYAIKVGNQWRNKEGVSSVSITNIN